MFFCPCVTLQIQFQMDGFLQNVPNDLIFDISICIYNLVLNTEYFENWYKEQTKDGTQPLTTYAKSPFDDATSRHSVCRKAEHLYNL